MSMDVIEALTLLALLGALLALGFGALYVGARVVRRGWQDGAKDVVRRDHERL